MKINILTWPSLWLQVFHNVTVPPLPLLVSGALTSYPPHCLGPLAGVIFSPFIQAKLETLLDV